jgi:hypothetical protein
MVTWIPQGIIGAEKQSAHDGIQHDAPAPQCEGLSQAITSILSHETSKQLIIAAGLCMQRLLDSLYGEILRAEHSMG